MYNDQDELYFVERMVAAGIDDYEWEVENSFYSEEGAALCARYWNDKGWSVRVTKGNRMIKEMHGV